MTKIEDLWNIFQVEYQQHIDDADSAIYQVVSLQPYDPKELLRRIFRSFHSLKGLARAMDLTGLEEITHKCEDYLNYLTENTDQFNIETAHEIGTILTEIQSFCQKIVQDKSNIQPNDSFTQHVNALTKLSSSSISSQNKEQKTEPTFISEPSNENLITEQDPGVIQFFLELLGKFVDVTINDDDFTEKQLLAINALEEIKLKSLSSILNVSDFSKLSYLDTLINELLSAKINDGSLFINVSNISHFFKHVVSPAVKQMVRNKEFDLLTSTISKIVLSLDTNFKDPDLVSLIQNQLTIHDPIDSDAIIHQSQACFEIIENYFANSPSNQSQTSAVQENHSLGIATKTGDNIAIVKQLAHAPVPIDVEKSIRVSGSTLENFMDNIGEIVLNNARLNHFLKDKSYQDLISQIQFLMKNKRNFGEGLFEKVRDLINKIDEKNEGLNDSIYSLNSSLSILHDTALDLRVVPMELIYRRLPRTIKLLASELQKEVNLFLEGHNVQIDKIMVDTLSDPIIHILRNALDHGIELPEDRVKKGKPRSGNITIKTEQQGSRIQLQIIDDGQGINKEKIVNKIIEKGLLSAQEAATLSDEKITNYIFHPGFSTASSVSNISGRGVGMDIVRMNVMQLGGTISIASDPGKGTTFTIKVPIAAAIQGVLIVSANGQKIAIPNSYVSEILQIPSEDIMTLKNNPACILRDQYLPIINLGSVLGFSDTKLGPDPNHTIVVISRMESTVGIEVDRVLEKTQVYMKEVDSSITTIFGIGGATIRGNGEVMIILDCEDIFDEMN